MKSTFGNTIYIADLIAREDDLHSHIADFKFGLGIDLEPKVVFPVVVYDRHFPCRRRRDRRH